jgi:hypothetical protein
MFVCIVNFEKIQTACKKMYVNQNIFTTGI